MEEKKTKKQQLEEFATNLGYTISITAADKVKVSLQREDKEIASITNDTEESACKKVLELLYYAKLYAKLCVRVKKAFGDALVAVIIPKPET